MSLATDQIRTGLATRPTASSFPEKTVSGLHDAAFFQMQRSVNAPARVLDLGAGSGAWAARLLKAGYAVTCVDSNGQDFALPDVPFVLADLNVQFSQMVEGEYAAVTAIEVIEHLENPTQFLRECRKFLGKSGILLITTPNIESVPGRLRFLLQGHFRMFGANERFSDPSHITPIQSYMFEKMVKASGLRVISHKTASAKSPISGNLVRVFGLLIKPFLTGFTTGDNHIYVLTPVQDN